MKFEFSDEQKALIALAVQGHLDEHEEAFNAFIDLMNDSSGRAAVEISEIAKHTKIVKVGNQV